MASVDSNFAPSVTPGIIRTVEDIVTECREFIGLKAKSGRERLDIGKQQYLLSKKWMNAYKEYIMYAEVKRNNKPSPPEEDKHPGPMENDKELCEVDEEGRNL